MRAIYPFSALVNQAPMRLALVLNAVNPRIGGVLIRGQKGTAKSTAARGLAALLPSVEVVDGCRFACEPRLDAPRCPDCDARQTAGEPVRPGHHKRAAFVELPIGATEDRVLGSLDLERAIADGQRHFEPGLLARANRGLLYVDEVNLLPDHLVDTLLDAAAMGTNTVERDGLSFSHPAAFVLVGTMNPEEGDLRPQLLDRFALAVDVEGLPDATNRAEVVRRRIAFEADPGEFSARWASAEREEQARIQAARALLPRVQLDDHLLDLIARICTAFDVEGLRADIVIYKTASTLAAYLGRDRVDADHIRQAAELALPHRRRRQPFDEPGLDRERLDEIVRDHQARSEHDQSSDPPPEDDQASDGPDGGDDGGPDSPGRPGDDNGASAAPPAEEVFEVASPPPLAPPPLPVGGIRGAALPAPPQRFAPRGATRRESPIGQHVRSTTAPTSTQRSAISWRRGVDLMATLHAAAVQQRRRRALHQPHATNRLWLQRTDLRFKVRQARIGICTLFVVDASGSMAARRRMALAKGAVLSLLLSAYQKREQVALIAFRGTTADVLLPPTTSVDLASARLRELPTGGRTPLAQALRLAHLTLARQTRALERPVVPLLVLVSDGRANVSASGVDPQTDALAAASALHAAGVGALVVDAEEGRVRLGLARQIALALGGDYVRLPDTLPHPAGEQALADAVRARQRIERSTKR